MLFPLNNRGACNLSYLTETPSMPELAPRAPSPRERFMAQMNEDRFERLGASLRHEHCHAPTARESQEAPAAPAPAAAQAQGGAQDLVAQFFQILQALLGLGKPEQGGPSASCPPTNAGAINGGKPDLYARVPEVDGSAAGWQRAGAVVEQRTTGTQANREGIHKNGQNPWDNSDGKMPERAAVYWAMQKNADVKYDADNKVFYTTRAGGERDQVVASLDDVMKAMNAAGGPSPSNGAGYSAVGDFINEAVRRSRGGEHGLG